MSDKDHPEEHVAPSSPTAVDTPSKGRGRGKGKGRGKRKSLAKAKTFAGVKKPVPTGRRGRIKQYNDPRVQAAYERQREVKSAYLSIISHMKPALEELASRNIEKLKKDPEIHKTVPEFDIITEQLDTRLTKVLNEAQADYDKEMALLNLSFEKDREFIGLQHEVSISSLVFFFFISSFVLPFPNPPPIDHPALPPFSIHPVFLSPLFTILIYVNFSTCFHMLSIFILA